MHPVNSTCPLGTTAKYVSCFIIRLQPEEEMDNIGLVSNSVNGTTGLCVYAAFENLNFDYEIHAIALCS